MEREALGAFSRTGIELACGLRHGHGYMSVPRLILDRIVKGVQAGFSSQRKPSLLTTIYSRRCCMQKLIGVAFAALCLMGISSLALADDAMKGETGNMKGEMKAEKSAMKGEMKAKKEERKGKMKAHKDGMKAKRHETKEKMKAHKVVGKTKAGEAKDAAQSMGQDMKAIVPAAPTSVTAP
jgi:hypothetical protein